MVRPSGTIVPVEPRLVLVPRRHALSLPDGQNLVELEVGVLGRPTGPVRTRLELDDARPQTRTARTSLPPHVENVAVACGAVSP